MKKKILITGAGGRIGTFLRQAFKEEYDLRLMLHRPREGVTEGEVIIGNIEDPETMLKACEGVHTVVHMAANPSMNATWEQVLQNNIIGTQVVYEAARQCGCQRVVFASSIHAVGGYPREVQVRTDMPVRPCCLYGVSKCFGEALARQYADQYDLSSICIRIGGVHSYKIDLEKHPFLLEIGISDRDLTQLVRLCIEAEGIDFAIVHGLSNNPIKKLDLSDTCKLLGYAPQDNYRPDLLYLAERANPRAILH